LRVGGCLGELENRRRLTHEIIPAYHHVSPRSTSPQRKITSRANREFRSLRMYKNEHVELRAGWFHRRNTVNEVSGCAARERQWLCPSPSLGRFAYRCRVRFDRVWHPLADHPDRSKPAKDYRGSRDRLSRRPSTTRRLRILRALLSRRESCAVTARQNHASRKSEAHARTHPPPIRRPPP
jgi:hypothetical protein